MFYKRENYFISSRIRFTKQTFFVFLVSVCQFDQAPRVTGTVAAVFAESSPPFSAGATITWFCTNNNEQVVGEDTTTCQDDGSWMPATGLGYCGMKFHFIVF